MKYNILGYLIGEGFSNVFKNKKSTGASLIIMCATMIIFGVFLILGENINHFVDQVKSEQGFQVFIKTDATQEEIDAVGEQIRAIDGVNTADFVSKEDALNSMRERLKDTKGVLDGFDVEQFKASSFDTKSTVFTPSIALISSPTLSISSCVASTFIKTLNPWSAFKLSTK